MPTLTELTEFVEELEQTIASKDEALRQIAGAHARTLGATEQVVLIKVRRIAREALGVAKPMPKVSRLCYPHVIDPIDPRRCGRCGVPLPIF